MKPAILAILSLYLANPLLAQSNIAGQQIIQKKCRTEHARLWLEKYGRNYSDLFNDIQVLDARPDTSRIGIVRTGGTSQHEILLEKPVASQLTEYLNAIYARPKGGHSLLIVLKDLWIACPDSAIFKWGYPHNFYFHVEAYLRAKDGFMPLVSMDTTLRELKGEPASVIAEQHIRALFDEFMYRAAGKDLDKERRIVSTQEIDSFNRTRFDYPMDTATQLVKGAYRSIDEFLNNAPSIGKAEFSADDGGNYELHIPDENGQMYYTHTVWGYCDGSHAYVMMDGNLFPVFSVHHQFYALGSKEYHLKGGMFVPFFIPLGPVAVVGYTRVNQEMARSLRVFRIDTGTGQVIE